MEAIFEGSEEMFQYLRQNASYEFRGINYSLKMDYVRPEIRFGRLASQQPPLAGNLTGVDASSSSAEADEDEETETQLPDVDVALFNETGQPPTPWPEVILDRVWERHYITMLSTVYPLVRVFDFSRSPFVSTSALTSCVRVQARRLSSIQNPEQTMATESAWRSYVYAASDQLVFSIPDLAIERYRRLTLQ